MPNSPRIGQRVSRLMSAVALGVGRPKDAWLGQILGVLGEQLAHGGLVVAEHEGHVGRAQAVA